MAEVWMLVYRSVGEHESSCGSQKPTRWLEAAMQLALVD
jgi:hypothetical protein